MLNHINTDSFTEEVLNSKGIVVVDFFATWCAPCKMLSPILEELQTEMGEKVKIVKLDVDESGEIANKYGVQSIPTIKIFKDGADVETKVGFMPKEVLKEALEEVL
ncbi:thioredoxin [Clostridium sp. SHJSY1]|uniref:thioredoxin n=1 Tax=Clostridium sp. SHJSY1 TaxID=2942483 RepID=UPI002876D8ED|nr:thioredoxin [Clostridium sp. SHJSY1]MDS0524383.1 thioredoxin [Clostridium sp. SHJSY1]